MIPLMLMPGWRYGGCSITQEESKCGPMIWIVPAASLAYVDHNTRTSSSPPPRADDLSPLGYVLWCDCIRVGIQSLCRQHGLHFVGDFGGIEPSVTAASAFQCFGDFFSCLGLHMKAKKAEPPNHVQKLLGVIIEIEHNGVRLSPCPERITKLLTVLTVQHLDT